MSVTVAGNAGFCFGVERAAQAVEEALQCGARVYTYGELIHNPVYIQNLTERGACVLSYGEALCVAKTASTPTRLIIRAHGIPINEENELLSIAKENPYFSVIDMTCPFVKRIHDFADKETGEDTVTFLLCKNGHPESIGILSHVMGEKYAVADLSELESLALSCKNTEKTPVLLSQTTASKNEFKKCEKFFKKLFTNSKIFDTICNVTDSRQKEAATLAKSSDVMLVIGGRSSSNTQKLYDICRLHCDKTYHVESVKDLTAVTKFDDTLNIGITAGASTPLGLIKEILTQWKK